MDMTSSIMKIAKTSSLMGALVAISMHGSNANASTVIYHDDFDGQSSLDLGFTTPDVSLTGSGWVTSFARGNGGSDSGATTIFTADGTVQKVGPDSTHSAGALLPFEIQGSLVYTLQATFMNDNSSWLALGFASSNGDLDGIVGRHTNQNPAVFGGYAFGLSRNNTGTDQEFFNGIGSSNLSLGGDLANPAEPVTLAITLDTTGDQISAEYFLNGVQQGSAETLDPAAFNNIDFVGFSTDGDLNNIGSGIASISEFTFSSVPEPSSLFLFALGSIGLFVRRRKV